MTVQAPIIEIFSSYQGEGPHLGERHLFVRFQDCELSCKFCDTPLSFIDNKFCRVEQIPFSKKFKNVPNPMTVESLNSLLADFDDSTLSVTGGEPLQKTFFLQEWLPTLRPRFKVLLETAGVHFGEFRDIAASVDIVSMDLKLPSVTGMHPWWREHEAFLKAALEGGQREVYVKIVISSEVEEKDVVRSIDLLGSFDSRIPVILQPASAFGRFRTTPSIEQVSHWQQFFQKSLANVRVIPQMHKLMSIA